MLSLGLDVDDAFEALPDVQWPVEEGDPPCRLSIAERRETYSALTSLLQHRIAPPVAMGLGHTDLASKAACLTYTLALESETPQVLHRLCHSIRAFCTDMGTEMGVTSFQGTPEALLPKWHPFARPCSSSLEVDAAADVYESSDALLPMAVPIPGLCHIIHNLSADVDRHMPGFADFYSQLKNTGALLCRDQRRKRLWFSCVAPVSAAPEQMFERQVPSIYEKRWGCVVQYIQQALPLLRVLRSCWHKQQYALAGKAEESESGAVDLDLFSATLASFFFFAYAEMVLQVHGLAEDVMGWAESCTCHEPVFRGLTESQRHSALKSDAGEQCSKGCCMQGFRAPELACGDVSSTFSQLQATRSAVLHTQSQHHMSAEEWGVIMRDFELGSQFLQLGLTVKLSSWSKLPWRLAGLSHHYHHKARAAARGCLHMWDSLPEKSLAHHHPLSQLWLSTHRTEVEHLANGGSRSDWSQELQQQVACFRFWPCSERIIEATHKNAKKYAGFDRATPVTYSTSLRSNLTHLFTQDNLPLLLGCIGKARRMKEVVQTLGFAQHPTIKTLLQAKAHSTKIHTSMAKILYRADALDLFHDTSAKQKQHKISQGKRKRASAAAAGVGSGIPLSLPTVVGSALVEHLRRSLKPGMIISFPRRALPCQPISRALMGGTSAASSASQLQLLDRNRDADTFLGSDDDIIFAKVLHMTPAAWRTVSIPAHQGGRVSERAIAFGPLTVASDLGDIKLVTASLADEVLVAQEWHKANITLLRQQCRVWDVMTRQEPLVLLLPPRLVAETELSIMLHWLIRQKACANLLGNIHARLLHDDPRVPVVQSFADRGLMTCSPLAQGFAVQITVLGMGSLEVTEPLASSSMLCEVRADVPSAELHTYELILRLHDAGWEWRPLPSRLAARNALPHYTSDRDKIWL